MMNTPRSLPPGPGSHAIAPRRQWPSVTPATAGRGLAGPEPAPPSDWQRVLQAVARHKWMVLAIVAAGTALGVLGTRMMTRQYQAKAILWIEGGDARRDSRDLDRDNIISAEAVTEAPGWLELIKANTVMDSVVRGLRLFIRPAEPVDAPVLAGFTIADRVRPGRYALVSAGSGQYELKDEESGDVLERGTAGDSVGRGYGFRWQPPASVLSAGREIKFSVSAPYETAQDIVARLKVRTDEGGSFLVVQLKDRDPERAAATINAITARLVAVAAEMKRQKFEELASILGGQYEVARLRLDTAELALRSFRVRNAHILGAASFGTAYADPYSGQRRPAEDAGAPALRGSLEQLRADRAAIDAALAAPRGTGQVVDGLAAVGAAQQSPRLQQALQEVTRKQAELRDLRARYTDEATPVVALRQQIDSLEGTVIPGLARQLQSELETRQGAVQPRVNAAMGSLRRLPILALDETRLARDVEGAAELANDVRQRYETARLALVSSLPDVRVLDAAMVPSRPLASVGPILVALAFFISLAIGVAASLLRVGIDPKVRYPEQVTHQMRLPILAAMPHVSWRLGEEGSAPVVEALRGLRLRVLQSHTETGPLVLTITSPAMGEGKSFISSNLALSFADAGYRTILVDGDVRRGAQHLALDAQQRPGLTDVLAGKAELKVAVQDTGFPGLQLVAAGSRMHRAPELLLSPRLRTVIDELRGLADVIIVDSPPLAAGVDPIALGTVTGSLMLVLRQGTTDMPLALSKLDLLEQFPIHTIGAVLNDVPERGAFKYYTYEPDESEFLPSGEDDGDNRRRPPILAGKGPQA